MSSESESNEKDQYESEEKRKLRGTYGTFLCDTCGIRLVSKGNLTSHILSKHVDVKRFTCHICGKNFIINSRLQRHLTHSHSHIHYRCLNCETIFKCKEYLDGHIARCQFLKKAQKPKIKKIRKKEEYPCKFCNEKFKTELLLINHYQIIHKNNKSYLTCEFCFKEFSCRTAKKHHILAKHIYTRNNFKCTYCDKSFKLQTRVRYHIKTMHEGKIMNCYHCSYNTRNRSALTEHIFHKHFPQLIRKYKCYICSKKFKKQITKERHDFLAHNIKITYSCDVCKFQTYKRYKLNAHKKTHSKKEPVKVLLCTICDETFKGIIDYRTHMRILHKSDDYTCKYCKQMFNTRRHKFQHTAKCVERFRCSICSKLFDDAEKLNLHNKKDHVVKYKPIPCDLCKLVFLDMRGLNCHKNLQHAKRK